MDIQIHVTVSVSALLQTISADVLSLKEHLRKEHSKIKRRKVLKSFHFSSLSQCYSSFPTCVCTLMSSLKRKLHNWAIYMLSSPHPHFRTFIE